MPDYLLEIGTEELPAEFVSSALKQWDSLIPKQLEEEFLKPQNIKIYATPRRLAVLIEGLPERQSDRQEEIKGPPVSAAYAEGKPTAALEGFLRKQSAALEDVSIQQTDKGGFVFLIKNIAGQTSEQILPRLSVNWISQLQGKRFMRWGDGELRFPRPIRWLLALLDQDILPLELVNGSNTIKSDRLSYGHRILHLEPVTISSPSDYLSELRKAYVEPDSLERRRLILEQIDAAAAQTLGAKAQISDELLEEVINLVEYPTAIVGEFEAEFLHLPVEVITTVMVTHQRYFPVKKDGQLLANFITISNGDPAKKDIISQGNARVIRARLADAQFFFQADRDEPLESYLPQLESVTFQEELGNMRSKVDRIIDIAQEICAQLSLSKQQQNEVESAALLCKADLVTQMVYEFPELQGIMGRTYAISSGESEQVAQAILEHYLPRTADDQLPQSLPGQIVGIADRLDTLVSIFGIEQIPTGSSDPFALRRSANAIINVIWSAQLPINLAQLITESATDFVNAHPQRQSPQTNVNKFFLARLKALLQDDLKIDYDLVDALLAENILENRALSNLLDLRKRAHFLQSLRDNNQLEQIYETINRSARLASKGSLEYSILDPQGLIKSELFEKSSEQRFYNALLDLLPKTQAALKDNNYQLLVEGLITIAPIVSDFFDGEDSVLVIAEDLAVRENRLNLLSILRNHCHVLADFGAIVKG